MIVSLKISRLTAFVATAFVAAGVLLAPSAQAGASQEATRQGTFQTLKPSVSPVAAKLKTPGKGLRRDCNGQTSDQCCEGLSFCGCLYMPGSDNTHPTACFSRPPPKG
ncbi:putative Secreted protein [Hyphomicrobium sp. 1Nfss2.1]